MMQVQIPDSAPASANMAAPEGDLGSAGSRRALAGFFVSGVLLSFLGAILMSWEHHVSGDYQTVSWYFAGLIAGLLSSVWISPRLLKRRGLAWTLAFACGLAGSALLYLAFVSPPISPWWRVLGMIVIGCSAGILQTAIFNAISPMYRHNPAATVNLAGILFGSGCFAVAMLISGAYFFYTAPAIQVWIAVIPGFFGWMYWRTPFNNPQMPDPQPLKSMPADLRNPGAVLLSLLLFFQLGSEWSLAGWLALFLSQRLGISPANSLWILALYWFALTVGRAASQWILPRVRHSRLLLTNVVAAMFGCLILSLTNNEFGAITGVLLLGASFAPIYPLVVEKIGHRFPNYHPGFYNGIFSVALSGGFVAPWLLGFAASYWGIGAAMIFPLTGSILVFLLLVLVWLENRLSTHVDDPKAVGNL
ncbi:MAG: MFS transporter [Acidobacteriota bacterium]